MTIDGMAEVFEAIARRHRDCASAFRFTGRFKIASDCEARASAFDEAARMCREARVVDWQTILEIEGRQAP